MTFPLTYKEEEQPCLLMIRIYRERPQMQIC